VSSPTIGWIVFGFVFGGDLLRRMQALGAQAPRWDCLAAWGKPRRIRATYRRLQGVRHFLGFQDLQRDCLGGVFRRRKRIPDVLEAFRRLRRCYPRRRLLVVMDDLPKGHST